MLENYNKASELIQKNIDLFNSGINLCHENIINEKIRNIEEILEVVLPKSYIMFLQKFGVLSFGKENVFSVELY